jgi:hypothetical protein
MGALLQLIGEPPDDQIATEAQGQSGVTQCPPDAPQLRCRPIDQPGDFAIKPRQVWASQTVVSAAVWTETRGRLARVRFVRPFPASGPVSAFSRRLSGDDRFSSITRLKAAGMFGVLKIRALSEATYYAGLRKAGMPEE